MRLHVVEKLAGIAVAAVAAASLSATDAAAQKVRWKMHSAFGTNVDVLGPVGPRIADAIREMSQGDFDIKVFEPGALAGGFAYYDPVQQGAFEAAYGTPGANQGKNPVFAFAATWPFGPGALEFNAWLLEGGGVELIEEIYARDGIKYFYCGLIPPETSGWFREKIDDLEQLKGLKMRFFGVGAKVMQKLGVATQQLAAGDIYPALELGTLDATEFSMPSMDRSLGFHQVAKFNYFPGWHQQSTTNEILVNMAAWEELPDHYKAMFETACKANGLYELADGEASQSAAMLANEKDGVQNVDWSQEQLDAYRTAWEEVLQEELAASEDVKKLWDSYQAFREEYKVWGDKAYLD
jgi:TRAP-type mannitol/chloroaromatic compound transport system substrate-binding protein